MKSMFESDKVDLVKAKIVFLKLGKETRTGTVAVLHGSFVIT